MVTKTEQDQLIEKYAKFNISPNHIPPYETPEQFAQTFTKCSILTYNNVYYSNSTAEPNTDNKK